jgi:hypothetical protein
LQPQTQAFDRTMETRSQRQRRGGEKEAGPSRMRRGGRGTSNRAETRGKHKK